MTHPFVPAPNTALIEMVYTYQAQIIENTFHIQKGSPFTAAQLSAACDTFDNWDGVGATRWSLQRYSSCVLQQVKARALDTSSSPVFIKVLPVPRIGAWSASGSPMPGNVTFCLTLQTGLAGRSQRGRIYFPGLVGNMFQAGPNANDVTTAFANGCVASLNALIAQCTAAGLTLVVTSFYHAGAWRVTASNTAILNAAYADLHADSQRRRLAGRGN